MKRERTLLNETVTLGKDVIVTDPCYELDTWCNIVLDNVKPGKYHVEFFEAEDSWDGHAFLLTHEKYKLNVMPREQYAGTLGIDAGMVGIFPLDEFKNDSIVPSGTRFQWKPNDEPGEKWYGAMCNANPYILLSNCFNSSSGYGDGSAELRVDKNSKGEIYRMAVIF